MLRLSGVSVPGYTQTHDLKCRQERLELWEERKLVEMNKYVWRLYRESAGGRRAVRAFTELQPEETYGLLQEAGLCGNVSPWYVTLDGDDINSVRADGYGEFLVEANILDSSLEWQAAFEPLAALPPGKAARRLESMIERGVKGAAADSGIPSAAYDIWITEVTALSLGLFRANRDAFVPWLFQFQFDLFGEIAQTFGIPVPPIPKKSDLRGRALYYLRLCESLTRFRLENSLSPEELCCLLYDYGPRVVGGPEAKKRVNDLPRPLKAWFTGGGKDDNGDFEWLDNAGPESTSFWQGNPDAGEGDIVVMYCLAPRSCVHSVWRVVKDAYVDPFFFYYHTIHVGHPVRVPPVTLNELKAHPVLSNMPIVRKNMQGVNGTPISQGDYAELLRCFGKKGANIRALPKICRTLPDSNLILSNERDVEIQLVEPLLARLGYTQNDWIRQLPVKMGRGYRVYPDYALLARAVRGEESALLLVEAKHRIPNATELRKAYYQALSYAYRLRSDGFLLAAEEGVWAFRVKDGECALKSGVHRSWHDLSNADTFHELLVSFGKNVIIKGRRR